MHYEHVDNVSLYTYIDTYIDTYIHRYNEFAICYSCIRGSLKLAPNYSCLYALGTVAARPDAINISIRSLV